MISSLIPGLGVGGMAARAWNKSAPKVDYSRSAEDDAAQARADEASALASNQARGAKDYRQKLPGTQESMMHQASDVGRRGLAEGIVDARRASSSRGLLFSGLRQGAEAGAASDYLSGLSQARSGINEQTNSLADQMSAQAKQSGVGAQQAQQGLADAIYNRQMQQFGIARDEQGKRQAALGQATGGLASLGGMLAGSR